MSQHVRVLKFRNNKQTKAEQVFIAKHTETKQR